MKFEINRTSTQWLHNLPHQPGIYIMRASDETILYVGKAVDLQKRVSSYFRQNLTSKTQKLMALAGTLEIIVTRNEVEALLLEQTNIKSFAPPFNVLLRDDKSYPYIFISNHPEYPYISLRRKSTRQSLAKKASSSKTKKSGEYFGPYPNSYAVRSSINTLQTIFKLRTCEDNFFAHRTRPCLQHQIKRCSAPCVQLISPEDYREDLQHAELFLRGKSNQVITHLEKLMQDAAKKYHYETAAHYRDQMQNLKSLQSQQGVDRGQADADIWVCGSTPRLTAVQLLMVRRGKVLGKQSFYPKNKLDLAPQEILSSLIAQRYLNTASEFGVPENIITNYPLDDKAQLMTAIKESQQISINIQHQVRGIRAEWLALAAVNLQQILKHSALPPEELLQRRKALQQALSLPALPARIECFDISHTQGEATMASCVVFNEEGPEKKSYRRFNINDITPGDDYAAIRQAIKRRYTHLQKTNQAMPDILLIDGGKGQLTQALALCEEFQLPEMVIVAIAKGLGRKAGLERLFIGKDKTEIVLPEDNRALHYLQWIRDEAHRFAIKGHRAKRGKKRKTSVLDSLPHIGPKRRQALLKHFGSLRDIHSASIDDIARVPGINRKIAETLYNELHEI